MADGDIDITRTRLGDYTVTWKTYAFGGVDKVTPDISLVTKDIMIGTIGAVRLGRRVIAVDGSINVEMREIDVAAFTALMPWATTGSPLSLNPATVHQDLYEYADKLVLHPTDVATATTDQDITLLKAVPTFKPMDRDGTNDDKVLVSFQFFPDRDQLPALVYGYIGAAPAV